MGGKEPTVKEMLARREREIRIIQAIVGAVVGAVGLGYTGFSLGFASVVLGVVGGVLGGIGGYHAPPWLSALDE